MRRRTTNEPFTPFAFHNPYRVGAGPPPIAVAAVEVAGQYLCLEFQMGVGEVVTFGVYPHQFLGGRYTKLSPESVDTELALLKKQALTYGATLEAIQLLNLTKQEELQMAEKLARKTADKEALKTAAKANPVAGKKAAPAPKAEKAEAAPKAKRPGNADALAKARAARGPAPNRKYSALVKAKDVTLREGTWTRYMVETMLANKDTDSAKAAHEASGEFAGKKLDFKWADEKEFIKLV